MFHKTSEIESDPVLALAEYFGLSYSAGVVSYIIQKERLIPYRKVLDKFVTSKYKMPSIHPVYTPQTP
jgi:hypothetical protein